MSILVPKAPEGCGESARGREGPAGWRLTSVATGAAGKWQALALAILGCIWLCDPEQDAGPL